jgi:hypothetical protein
VMSHLQNETGRGVTPGRRGSPGPGWGSCEAVPFAREGVPLRRGIEHSLAPAQPAFTGAKFSTGISQGHGNTDTVCWFRVRRLPRLVTAASAAHPHRRGWLQYGSPNTAISCAGNFTSASTRTAPASPSAPRRST